MVGAGCGVGVPAGESDGDSSELISIMYNVHNLLRLSDMYSNKHLSLIPHVH
jgi:hypothetical protein